MVEYTTAKRMKMGEWREYKLGDFVDIKHGYAFSGKNITDVFTTSVLVTPGNFHIGGGFKNSKFKFFNAEFPDDYVLKQNDVVVTMTDLSKETDTLGYSAKIPKSDLVIFLHNQRIGLLQFKTNKVEKDFIYWLLRTRDYQAYIVGSASGTSIMHTSPSRIKDFTFLLPSFSEQTAIASILSSLDDKIDLLHKQNVTLEKMAEALFRKWFVEEAKEQWEEKSLSSIAHFLNGLACQKFPPKNQVDKLPVLKIKELGSGISENSDWATSEVKPEYIVRAGDVIFAWSASLMVKIWHGQDCILNQHLFKVTSENYPQWFYYLWCKYHLNDFIAKAASHATTMGHIKRGDLDNAMVSCPTNFELEKMSKVIQPIIEKIKSNQTQIRTLTQLRDTLLPKLMSGEVRVKM